MIKIENVEIAGLEPAIRVLHSFNDSWGGDSKRKYASWHDISGGYFDIGPNDLDLMIRLRNAGIENCEFMQMITVYLDITAPSYWWKEFDAYRVCTVNDPYSMAHKILGREFTPDDFSCESLINEDIDYYNPSTVNQKIVGCLNECRKKISRNQKYEILVADDSASS